MLLAVFRSKQLYIILHEALAFGNDKNRIGSDVYKNRIGSDVIKAEQNPCGEQFRRDF